MRKIFTSLVVAGMLMMTVPASAQFKAGVTAGLNITTMHYGAGYSDMKTVTGEMKNQAGYHLGATAVYTIPKSIVGFDLSALYDHRSAKTDNSPVQSFKSQTIQIPLNVRVQLYDYAHITRFFVFAGPQLALNVGKKDQFIASNSSGKQELLWQPKSSTWSLNMGIGAMAMDHVQVKFGYNLQLGDIGDFERVNYTTGVTTHVCSNRSNSCQVSVTYFF